MNYHEAHKDLFGDELWICVDGNLHQWQTSYYQKVADEDLISKIQQYCFDHPAIDKNYTGKAREILKLKKNLVTVSANKINPSGINCTNGVLIINWENNTPKPELIPHDPKCHYYTKPPLVKYDPEADSTECDKLLACLDPAEREVFLRIVSASIDLPKVRKIRGREVKILLLRGEGSNGKDALRHVVSTIHSHSGMTSCSLRDFAAYDKGRKFDLSVLKDCRVNWPSENSQFDRIDGLQSLKLFATGEKLHAERKGRDSVEFTPEGVCFINTNDVPNLERKLQAIIDRVAIIQFRKIYTKSPSKSNELLADPRFVYDRDFVAEDVAPAFLNKMLQALTDLCKFGIDYSCTEKAFEDMQKDCNHLRQFCSDEGIVADDSGVVSAKQLFKLLEEWYKADGTLMIEDDGKRVWIERTPAIDKNVKAINQVIPRFLEIFPNAQRPTVPHPKFGTKRPIPALKGISLPMGCQEQQNNNLTVEKNMGITQNRTTTAQSVSTVTNPYIASPPQPARSIDLHCIH